MRWVSHQQGWFKVSNITKVRHTMLRSREYADLLWTVTHQLSDNAIVKYYLVEDISRLRRYFLAFPTPRLNPEP